MIDEFEGNRYVIFGSVAVGRISSTIFLYVTISRSRLSAVLELSDPKLACRVTWSLPTES